jgi:predicted MFS family arabinose efflux permease
MSVNHYMEEGANEKGSAKGSRHSNIIRGSRGPADEAKNAYESDTTAGEAYVNPLEEIKFHCFGKPVSEKYYMLILFFVINLFLFADQNLMAPNLTLIASEYNFTEDERDRFLGGYISIGFFAVGGIISMIVGYLADTVNRKWVFVITVAIGEVSCAATYFVATGSVTKFWTGLWLARAITGFALGGALPIQFSLLGDIFNEEERGRAVAFTGIANALGTSFGQYLANNMPDDWRTPFLIVSLPTFLFLAVYLTTTEEPARGGAERLLQGREDNLDGDHKITWEKLRGLTKTPSAMLLILQGVPGTLPWGTFGTYLNDFMKEDLGVSTSAVANSLLFFGLVGCFASFYGGFLVDKFIGTRPRVLPLIAGFTTLFAAAPFIFIVKSPTMKNWVYSVLIIPSGFVASLAGPIIKGVLLHVTLPETRGTAFALQSLMDELGKGFGPFILSIIIEQVPERSTGMMFGLLGWIPCALIMLSVYFTIVQDIKRNQLAIAEAYGIVLSEDEIQEIDEFGSRGGSRGGPSKYEGSKHEANLTM